MHSKPQARVVAAQIISHLSRERINLSALLPKYLPKLKDPRDKALAQEICFGICRWYFPLEYILNGLLDKPLRNKDSDLKALILAGLYQFIYLRIPPHAIVSTTVDACNAINKAWARGFVNALLRRFQREQQQWVELINKQQANLQYSMPEWLLQNLQEEFPEEWQSICKESNEHPPMFLRINRQKTTRDKYRQILAENSINASLTPYSDTGLRLDLPVDVDQLPDFKNGYVSVQDLAAQLCLPLLDLHNHQRILDACSAPGGKLAHILESGLQFSEVIALEKDKKRMDRLNKTLSRLQLHATLLTADARMTENWWDGEQFDRILLDAPCSATGVIRRHPDIKLLRHPEDITTVALLQSELLSALWPLLKCGGKLLYATCSILRRENDDCIRLFLENTSNANNIKIDAEWGMATRYGRQILPGQDNMDGFYYACLEKC